MVEYVVNSLAYNQIARKLGPAQQGGQPVRIMHVAILAHNDEVFIEHHLPSPPKSLRYFMGLPPVASVDRHHGQIVRRTGNRHRQLFHFGLYGQPDRCQENFLGGFGDIGVLLRRNAHQRRRINGIAPPRDGHHMEAGIFIGQRVKTRMVAERPFHRLRLRRIDIPFDHEIAVGRHINIVGDTLHQFHRAPAQKPCQQVFVHVVRHRSRRSISISRIAAQRYRHGHSPPGTPVTFVMTGSGLVQVPVHARRAGIKQLQPVHAHVADSRFGIEGVHQRQRHEASAVARPALEHRQRIERRLLPLQHDLLTFAPRRRGTRQPARHLGQQRQHPQFIQERIFRRDGLLQQIIEPSRQFVERLHAERHRHPTVGTHHIGQHGKRRPRLLEQQRLAAVRLLGHAVGNLGDLIHRIHRHAHALQFAFPLQAGDKFTQVAIHKSLH